MTDTNDVLPTPSKPRPPLDEGWNPTQLSLKLSRKHPKLSRMMIQWEIYRAEKSTGPGDLSDLLLPGQDRAADFPNYYVNSPVHGMTGLHGMDPSMGKRLEDLAENFPLGSYEQIRWWIESYVVEAGVKPTRILDVGTGTGATAFVYAELFPEAEVIGIDISPPVLRWAKKRAAEKGLTNLSFYHLDAGRMSAFEDDSFDIVHESHVLHEMPTYQINRVVSEMVRITKPGGFLGFFDWAIPENEGDWKHRQMMVRVNAEPFMMQYAEANFPAMLEKWGCTGVVRVDRHSQSASWRANKGEQTNALLAPDLAAIAHN